MELVVILVIIFVIYGAGWIWQTVNDVLGDARRSQWDRGVFGQVASPRSVRKSLGGKDLAQLRLTFERFAELYDGQAHTRQLFESPKVSFTWHGTRALLSIYEASESDARFYTQITFTVPDGWSRRLEIFPQRFQEGDVRYLNVDDIRIGDEAFDPRWIVKSDDAAFARDFLDGRTRQAVEDLRNLVGNDRLLVSLNGSRLMVRKQDILSKSDELVVFSELASHVCDRVLQFWQRQGGIDILDDAPGPGAAPPVPACQICGKEIPRHVLVYCRRCRTPHHEDCWEFNGRCSSHGCDEKGVERPDAAPPVPVTEASVPTCQVCGAKIPADIRVFCRRCRTPHHKECWEYNGRCSTYACGEEGFRLKY